MTDLSLQMVTQHMPIKICIVLTQVGRDKMTDIFTTIFSNEFPWMKIFEFWIQFDWSLFLDNITPLVQILAWRRTGDKPLSEPMMPYVGDAYMRHSASVS